MELREVDSGSMLNLDRELVLAPCGRTLVRRRVRRHVRLAFAALASLASLAGWTRHGGRTRCSRRGRRKFVRQLNFTRESLDLEFFGGVRVGSAVKNGFVLGQLRESLDDFPQL